LQGFSPSGEGRAIGAEPWRSGSAAETAHRCKGKKDKRRFIVRRPLAEETGVEQQRASANLIAMSAYKVSRNLLTQTLG